MSNWINLIIRSDKQSSTLGNMAENPGLTALGGMGLGAGLMFIFDPIRGKRRRALIRDRLVHARNVCVRAMGITSRDLRHRASGMLAEGRCLFQHKEVSDEVLAARVRAKIGRSVSHPHAISVSVKDGRVTLSGQVLAYELNRMFSGVSSVRGVRKVENQLTVHTRADDVPSLQGGRPRTGDRFVLMQSNWSPTARLLTGIAGGTLMVNCLRRHDLLSTALGTVGFGLFMRGITNKEIKNLVGIGRDCGGVEVQKTININAPVERVFEFWTNYQNFPRFMSHVREVRSIGNDRSHWVVDGPGGIPVEWTAEIIKLIPNKLLAWRSINDSSINHTGIIHFEPNRNGGTRIHIRLSYHPFAGALGHAFARISGSDPKSEMDADLLRMKTFIESGHPPHDAANPLPIGTESTSSQTTGDAGHEQSQAVRRS
jgi:uncharacterized membrane protein